MANAVAVVTPSGFGKSTSIGNIPELGIEGLNPKETAIINVMSKPLPFKGWRKLYKPPISDGGNYVEANDAKTIIEIINYIGNERQDIKNVVLDDFQYVMAEEFVNKARQAGYDKFTILAQNAYNVLRAGRDMRSDMNFFVLTHQEQSKQGLTEVLKIKTIGKMLDEKVTLEGLFTIILYGKQSFDDKTKKVTKEFVTNFDGEFPAKSPVGMFPLYMPNDLGIVVKEMNKYYEGE